MRAAVVMVLLIGCTPHVHPGTPARIARGEACRITVREGDGEQVYERDERGRVVLSPYFARGFDRDGRWITEERSGTRARRRFDRAGRVARIDYRDGMKTWSTRIVRDDRGRIVEKLYGRPPGLPPWQERWTYDAHGHLLRYRHTEGDKLLNEWAWTYDDRDRVATTVGLAFVSTGTTWSRSAWTYADHVAIERETTDGQPGVRTTTFRYDDAGRMIEKAYATDSGVGSTTIYVHDPESGELTDVHYPNHVDVHYERAGTVTRAGTKILDDRCPSGGEPIREIDTYFAPDRERPFGSPWLPEDDT